MLPAQHRLRKSADFRYVVRRGARGRSDGIVVHVVDWGDGPGEIGFVVGKAVGGAVERNRVRRRLQAIVATHLADGSLLGEAVVVRALPSSRTASFGGLSDSVDRAFARAHRVRDR